MERMLRAASSGKAFCSLQFPPEHVILRTTRSAWEVTWQRPQSRFPGPRLNRHLPRFADDFAKVPGFRSIWLTAAHLYSQTALYLPTKP